VARWEPGQPSFMGYPVCPVLRFPRSQGGTLAGSVRAAAEKVPGDPAASVEATAPGWDMKVARTELGRLLEAKPSAMGLPQTRVK
jgi:hypothetical protein